MMYENRIEKVLVLDKTGKLTGLVTMKDIEKSEKHPNATKDNAGQLRVGAAIGTGAETLDRAKSLFDSGVDLFVVDSAHGHTKSVIETVKKIKKEFPTKDIIAGNVATPEGAEALIEAGADGIKIGMGPGSICTTRIIAGIGVPQISAILTIYEKVKGKVPLIADGGMRYSGDIAKAIAAGADSVMLGSIFAGTEEAPGEFELYQGRSFKTYRGMGSLGAMSKEMIATDTFKKILMLKNLYLKALRVGFLIKDGLSMLLTNLLEVLDKVWAMWVVKIFKK